MLEVFYDNRCSMCTKEILFYKKHKAENVVYSGIFGHEDKLNSLGITQESALKNLHALHNNRVIQGLDVFIEIWRSLRFLKGFAVIISLPLIKQVFQCLYFIFRIIRYKIIYKRKK